MGWHSTLSCSFSGQTRWQPGWERDDNAAGDSKLIGGEDGQDFKSHAELCSSLCSEEASGNSLKTVSVRRASAAGVRLLQRFQVDCMSTLNAGDWAPPGREAPSGPWQRHTVVTTLEAGCRAHRRRGMQRLGNDLLCEVPVSTIERAVLTPTESGHNRRKDPAKDGLGGMGKPALALVHVEFFTFFVLLGPRGVGYLSFYDLAPPTSSPGVLGTIDSRSIGDRANGRR